MDPYIPKVNEEVCCSVEKEIADDAYLSNIAKHIATNNPTIGGFLHNFTGRLPLCCKKAAMIASLTIYRLIESQMEANQMKKDLKI